MTRIRFTAAYDGRPYLGWQSQPGGRTVQDVLERAFSGLFGTPCRIHGSGRTDAGVHALGQVTHAEYVPPGFHARFSATGKTYRYCISRAPILNPFDAGLAWHRPLAWSVDILEQAVHLFRGTHDFTAFAALRGNEPRPIPEGYFRRTITQTQVAQTGEHVFITFTGTGFLYKMVRLMTGAAHEAARGKITLEELARLINAPLPDDKSPFCAPPDGLTLMRVHYPEETFGDKKKIN